MEYSARTPEAQPMPPPPSPSPPPWVVQTTGSNLDPNMTVWCTTEQRSSRQGFNEQKAAKYTRKDVNGRMHAL
jgi:hypothetical protein